MKYEIAWMASHGTEVVAEANDVDGACEEAGRLLRLDGCFGVIVRDRSMRVPMVTLPKPDRRQEIALHPDPRD